MKIVVIDDDERFLNMMKRLLELENHYVEAFSSGEEALLKLNYITADLILTDFHLKGISGLDFIQKATDHNIGDAPFVIISGDRTILPIVTESELRVRKCLFKPIKYSQLEELLNEINSELNTRSIKK